MSPDYRKLSTLRHHACALWCALTLLGCAASRPEPEAESYVVSIAPLQMILQPLVGDVPVRVLLPPGASPHTYEPRPSDAASAWEADLMFHVDESLDGWASRMPARERVALLPMLPKSVLLPYGETCDGEHSHEHDHGHDHTHGETDPHFWTDPLTVAALVDSLAKELARRRPDRSDDYAARAAAFKEDLGRLDKEAELLLFPLKGSEVVVFHHALDYFLHRHGICVAAAIEPSPGQTAGPKTLHALSMELKARGVKAVFIEPQLSPQSAQAVAEEAGLRVATIDPLGGVEGRNTYRDLVLWNARAIRDALQ